MNQWMQLQNAVKRRDSASRMCKDDGSFWIIFHLVTLTTNEAKLVRVFGVLAGIADNVFAVAVPQSGCATGRMSQSRARTR